MKKPEEVLKIFEKYRVDLRNDLEGFIQERKTCQKMYDMMRYFFGWLDTDLKLVEEFGGKQFRGSLCLFVAEAISGDYKKALPVASSLELYHNFTLIHDDILDKDPLRRGRPTVWKLWGINHGINTGDAQYLISLISVNRLSLSPDKIKLISGFLQENYLQVIEGQYLDLKMEEYALGDERITKNLYMESFRFYFKRQFSFRNRSRNVSRALPALCIKEASLFVQERSDWQQTAVPNFSLANRWNGFVCSLPA